MKAPKKKTLKKIALFITNPRLLLCFGLAWMITNGWSYIFLGLGTYYKIGWMTAIAGAYLTFLWIPMTPEKILTIFLSIGLLKLLFPRDTKTLKVLTDMWESHKAKKQKKMQRTPENE